MGGFPIPRADCATNDSAITDARARLSRASSSGMSISSRKPHCGPSIASADCTSTRGSPEWTLSGWGSAGGSPGSSLPSTSSPHTCSNGTLPTSSSMSTPRYRSAPPSRSGSAISVSNATTPSRPGLKSFMARAAYRDRPGATSVESCAIAHRVTLIPGDGIGPELTEATRRVLEATGVSFEWDVQEAGADVMARHGGNPLPDETLESIRRNGVALKGPITTPIGEGFRSVNVGLRVALDLYAQVRPCKTYSGVRTRFEDVDIVVVREATEDIYAGIEFEHGRPETAELLDWFDAHDRHVPHRDCGLSIKPISISGTRRVFEFGFDYARRMGRRKLTAVHKANIMKFTDGLWLRTAREVAAENTDIEFDDRIVDNMCMQLVQHPHDYDVLVLPNLYGDILSDLLAGMIGGLGVAPGANFGDGVAVFEPTHGSAPKYTGQNKANPIAEMLSGMLMLRYLGEHEAGLRLELAIADLIREGKSVTYDMKPSRNDPTAVGTSDVADALIAKLQA